MAHNDPYLEKLLDRGAPASEKKIGRAASHDPRFGLPSDPEGLVAFRKLARFGSWGLGLHIIGFITVVCVGFIDVRLSVGGLGAYVVAFAAHVVITRFVRHPRFRGWQKRLPFSLVGWDALLSEKRVYADLCWTDISVHVNCTDSTRPYVAAALRLLVKRAEKAFYQVKIGGSDRRAHWAMNGDASASGSANMEVMKRLYELLRGELSQITKRTGGITAVTIEARGDEYQVDIEIGTGD